MLNLEKINLCVQIITGIAVIIGSSLIIYEIRQSRSFIQAELAADVFSYMVQQQTSVMGETPAKTLAKACTAPAELTIEDRIILNSYYGTIIDRLRRSILIEERSGEQAIAGNWRNYTGNFYLIFATDYGQWWWHQTKAGRESDIEQVGDQILQSGSVTACKDYFGDFDRWMQEDHKNYANSVDA